MLRALLRDVIVLGAIVLGAAPGPALGQDVHLELTAPADDLVLTARRNDEAVGHCPPSCALDLEPGAIELTLHRHGDTELLARGDFQLLEASVARSVRLDRSGERVAGLLLLGLVAVPGAAFAIAGLVWALSGLSGGGEAPTEGWVFFGVGDALFAVGLSLGLYFAFHFDDVGLELAPP